MLRPSILVLFVILLGAAPTTPAQGESDKGKLTADAMKATLDDMGFGPKVLDKGIFEFKVARNDYQVYTRVSVSTDGRYIYVSTRKGPLERPAEMPARFWKRLLIQNDDISSTSTTWSYHQESRYFQLAHYLPNRQVTPAKLRKAINGFHDLVKKNEDIWSMKEPGLSPIVDSPTDAKERARVQGRWQVFESTSSGKKSTEAQLDEQFKGKKIEFVFEKQGGSLRYGDARPFVSRMGPEVGQMAIYIDEEKKRLSARYKVEKDTLTLCLELDGLEYPATFESTQANRYMLFKLKRVKE